MNTGAAPWMSGWWGLLQFSTSHLPRRLHFLARCSVSLGQQKQSFFSLAKWAWWFTPRALKASQFSIWLLCEQIRLGFSRWESVASIDTEGNRLLGLLCVWLYFPPILSSLGDGLGGPRLVGCSLTDDAIARTHVCNQMSRSFNYGTLGLISIFLSPQQPLISLGSFWMARLTLSVAFRSLLYPRPLSVSTAMWKVLYRDHSWVKSSSEIKDCSQIGPCHSFFVSKLFLSFMQPLDISLWDLCQKPIIFRTRKLEKSYNCNLWQRKLNPTTRQCMAVISIWPVFQLLYILMKSGV